MDICALLCFHFPKSVIFQAGVDSFRDQSIEIYDTNRGSKLTTADSQCVKSLSWSSGMPDERIYNARRENLSIIGGYNTPTMAAVGPTCFTALMLPHDILSEIFIATVNLPDAMATAGYDSNIPTVGYLSNTNPIKLGHVCSHWRMVAINTSALWSNICIDHPTKSHIELTKLWLRRAGMHPLNITIRTSRYARVNSSCFTTILQSFVNRIDIWRSVDFELPLEVMSPFLRMLNQREGNAQQLESATITVQDIVQSSFKLRDHKHQPDIICIDSMWKLIHASPTLKYVNWKNLYDGLSLPQHAPFSTLTRLELDYPLRTSQILDILLSSPGMKFLRASGSPKPFVPNPPIRQLDPVPITHALQGVSLTISENAGNLFASITLPELRKLHITYQRPTSNSVIQSDEGGWSCNKSTKFEQFLLRSKCLLEDVWLNSPPCNEGSLRSFLCSPAFQPINQLRITGANLTTDSTIRLLTLQHTDTDIMPSIENLWLEMEDTEITDGLLSNMVASRWSQERGIIGEGAPKLALAEVHLVRDFFQPFGPMDISRLSLAELQGLRVTISPGILDMARNCNREFNVTDQYF